MIDEILQIKRRCDFGDEIGRSFDLTLGEVDGLLTLAEHQDLTLKDLAFYLDLSPSRTSRLVNRLIEKGLVVTTPDALDRRALLLALTAEGEARRLELLGQKKLCEQRLLTRLNPEEIRAVEDGLRILVHIM